MLFLLTHKLLHFLIFVSFYKCSEINLFCQRSFKYFLIQFSIFSFIFHGYPFWLLSFLSMKPPFRDSAFCLLTNDFRMAQEEGCCYWSGSGDPSVFPLPGNPLNTNIQHKAYSWYPYNRTLSQVPQSSLLLWTSSSRTSNLLIPDVNFHFFCQQCASNYQFIY